MFCKNTISCDKQADKKSEEFFRTRHQAIVRGALSVRLDYDGG